MELLIIAVFAGVLFGLVLLSLSWKIVSPAVDSGLEWLIHTFDNECGVKDVEDSAESGYRAGPAPLGITDS